MVRWTTRQPNLGTILRSKHLGKALRCSPWQSCARGTLDQSRREAQTISAGLPGWQTGSVYFTAIVG